MKSEQRRASAPEIWAVSDGRAGNAVQAGALATTLARKTGFRAVEKVVTLRRPFDLLPARAWAAIRPRPLGWPFSGLADGGRSLAPPWPTCVIGCGRRAAPFVAAIGKLSRTRTVQILDSGLSPRVFDHVVAPAHDRLSAPNVIATIGGLNDFDPAGLADAAETWRPRLRHIPSPRVAVLVGGPSRSAGFGAQALNGLCEGLTRLAIDGAGLMITPSRRTPRAVVDRLADTLAGVGGWVWPGVGDNPYPAILGLADAVVVTADSVNMASEAAATGKPVFIAPVDRVDAKIAAFHDSLVDHGAARRFDGMLDEWGYPPLREVERVADLLLESGRSAAPDAWPPANEGLNASDG